MNSSDTGYMRRLTLKEPLRADEVYVPKKDEERLVNMNRQQRRAWAREQQKKRPRP